MRVAVVVEAAWSPFSIELDPSTGEIDWARALPEPSPGSLEALELGLALGEAWAYGMGAAPVQDLLRECLALGAAGAAVAPDAAALGAALAAERFDLVLCPHRSGDQGPSPVAGMLAGLLDLPQATGVESMAVDGAEAVVIRRLDRGAREELAVPLPAVVAVEPGIVRPRAASPAALIATAAASIGTLPAVPGPGGPVLLGHGPPRPGPPRMRVPDASLPAEARIATVIDAAPESGQRELVSGTPDHVAGRIVSLLRERGYLD